MNVKDLFVLAKKLSKEAKFTLYSCVKVLKEKKLNYQEALKEINKKRSSIFKKKDSFDLQEGVVFAEKNGDYAFLIKIVCESDLLTKTNDFTVFLKRISDWIFEFKPYTAEELLKSVIDDNQKTIADFINEKKNFFKEEIVIKDLFLFEKKNNEFFEVYIHQPYKIAVVLKAAFNDFDKLGKIAAHIAGMQPKFISRAEIESKTMEKIKNKIFIETESSFSKKTRIKNIDLIKKKVNEKKLINYFQKNCLLEQNFLFQAKKKVKEILNDNEKLLFFKFLVLK